MSDSKNPFAASERRASAPRGVIVAWCVAGAALLAAAVLGVLWQKERQTYRSQAQVLHEELDKSAAELANALSIIQTNRDLIGTLQGQVTMLEQEKEMVGQMAHSLEDEMRKELESKDVTISKLQGNLTVTIVDRVMFDSGEAILKSDGGTVMQKIADLLASHPDIRIHVAGHTDNVPIRPTAKSRFASNWELSAARALAAVHFLTEKAGVDPRRVGAVGYGEFRPIADNATEEGRAKNRRIEVVVLPKDLASEPAADLVKTEPAKLPTEEVAEANPAEE